MATNLYFNNVASHAQQELINNLTSEVIQLHGMDVFYIPLTLIKEDPLLDEDVLSKFEGVTLPGGVTLNGKAIYDEAVEEILRIEEQMSLKWELPPDGFIG